MTPQWVKQPTVLHDARWQMCFVAGIRFEFVWFLAAVWQTCETHWIPFYSGCLGDCVCCLEGQSQAVWTFFILKSVFSFVSGIKSHVPETTQLWKIWKIRFDLIWNIAAFVKSDSIPDRIVKMGIFCAVWYSVCWVLQPVYIIPSGSNELHGIIGNTIKSSS